MAKVVLGVEDDVLPRALSPSRAANFVQCPVLYYLGGVRRLREPSTEPQLVGTLAHAAYEKIFDNKPDDRTPDAAVELMRVALAELDGSPDYAHLLGDPAVATRIAERAELMVRNWFDVERVTNFEPIGREVAVAANVGGVDVYGIIDRIDRVETADGRVAWIISDYKGLALDTPILTPGGWTTMADLSVGDEVYGADGQPCLVTSKSGLHHRPCFQVTFDNGDAIVADNVHLWQVDCDGDTIVVSTEQLAELLEAGAQLSIRTTLPVQDPEIEGLADAAGTFVECPSQDEAFAAAELGARGGYVAEVSEGDSRWTVTFNDGPHDIVAVEEVPSVPTQCIAVDSPGNLYLAGRSMIPTHNTGKVPAASSRYLDEKFFQLRTYAAALYELTDHQMVVSKLRLVHTARGRRDDVRAVTCDTKVIGRTATKIGAIGAQIQKSYETGRWTTKTGILCNWCAYKPMCPEYNPEMVGSDGERMTAAWVELQARGGTPAEVVVGVTSRPATPDTDVAAALTPDKIEVPEPDAFGDHPGPLPGGELAYTGPSDNW